jgi:hypothetical protein
VEKVLVICVIAREFSIREGSSDRGISIDDLKIERERERERERETRRA